MWEQDGQPHQNTVVSRHLHCRQKIKEAAGNARGGSGFKKSLLIRRLTCRCCCCWNHPKSDPKTWPVRGNGFLSFIDAGLGVSLSSSCDINWKRLSWDHTGGPRTRLRDAEMKKGSIFRPKDLLHRCKAHLSATYVENDFDIYHL